MILVPIKLMNNTVTLFTDHSLLSVFVATLDGATAPNRKLHVVPASLVAGITGYPWPYWPGQHLQINMYMHISFYSPQQEHLFEVSRFSSKN